MNSKGFSLGSILLVTAALYGCTEGDEAVINVTSTGGGDGGSSQNPASTCPSWADARPQDDDANDICQLPAAITEDRTLTSDKIWYMASRVTVGNGNQEMSVIEGTLESGDPVLDVTLTIDPGTEIKGRSGSFANLVITRGSKINAVGTGALPIIFSSDDDGYEGTGEWGGLIIQGYAPHNECLTANMGAVACNVDSEGESGFAGGYTADDDSGVLRYVIVTEGGFEFDIGNEINGISMVGVGSGTEMEYIQVNSNADDGVEFYGGTVSAKHIVLTGNLDDSVDWDEGWQGNLQYVLVIQSADTTGNIIEADTEGTLDFLSKPTIANGTFIGNGSKTTGAVFKATSGGFVHHSVITFDAAITGPTTCVDSSDAAISGTELVFTNVLGDCDISGDINLIPAPAAVTVNADYSIAEGAGAGDLIFDDGLGGGINNTHAESVADPDFFDVTDYAGAVDPAGGDDWYAGWTLEGSL